MNNMIKIIFTTFITLGLLSSCIGEIYSSTGIQGTFTPDSSPDTTSITFETEKIIRFEIYTVIDSGKLKVTISSEDGRVNKTNVIERNGEDYTKNTSFSQYTFDYHPGKWTVKIESQGGTGTYKAKFHSRNNFLGREYFAQ